MHHDIDAYLQAEHYITSSHPIDTGLQVRCEKNSIFEITVRAVGVGRKSDGSYRVFVFLIPLHHGLWCWGWWCTYLFTSLQLIR